MSARILSILSGGAAVLLFSACQNTMFIGEHHGMNLSVEAKSDATEPAKFNFGFESHTAFVVPPKDPLSNRALSSVYNVAGGELLSSASRFRILHTEPGDKVGNKVLAASAMTIQSAVATGAAANAVVSGSAAPPPAAGGGAPFRALRGAPSSRMTGFGAAAADIVKSPAP